MTEVLNLVFPEGIVDLIAELVPQDPEVEWESLYGSTTIYRTKHFITYGGGPEGGYVYFYREREAGWYSWERNWGTPPVYTKVEGQIAFCFGDSELIAVVPHDYEPPEDEEIIIASEDWSELISSDNKE